MGFHQLHWLDIGEYLSIAATAIGLLIAVALRQPIYIFIPVAIALVLNLINRLRLEQRSRGRIAGALKQLQRKFSEEIQDLEKKVKKKETMARLPVLPRGTDSSEASQTISGEPIASFQEDLATLERSLGSVVQYLNSYSLPERVEHLEKSFAQLRAEISRISRLLEDSEEIALTETEPRSSAVQAASTSAPPRESPAPPAQNWNWINTLKDHSESVTALAISSDGKLLASASWDRTLKLWSLANGNLIDTAVEHSQGLLAVTFMGYGDRNRHAQSYTLATGSFDQTIKLWSIEPRERDDLILSFNRTLTGHTGSIHALAIAPDRQILVSGSYDQTIKQWDLARGEMLTSSYDELGAIYAIALDRESQFIASGGGDGRITLWQLSSGERLGFLPGNVSSVESLAISPDGQTLAAGCADGRIKFWQLEPDIFQSGREPLPSRVISAHVGQVMSLAFSADGQTLFSSGADGRIKIWYPDSTEALAVLTLDDHEGDRLTPVFSLTLSPDGQLLAAGGAGGTIKIWRRH